MSMMMAPAPNAHAARAMATRMKAMDENNETIEPEKTLDMDELKANMASKE